MSGVRLIDIREEILAENRGLADALRERLSRHGTALVNLMSSPGSGKTSLIVRSIARLKGDYRIAVIEGDIDSAVDAERVSREGVPAVQIRTGGSCHLSPAMVEKGLDALDLDALDLVFLENIGNLICPAECDTGATLDVVLASIPEGDDKPLKYPLIFRVADAVIISKTDVADRFDFDGTRFRHTLRRLNPDVPVFEISSTTGQGIDEWCDWLRSALA